MERIDLITEITVAFENKKFRQKDVLESLNLKNKKRAKKLWAALRRYNVVNKLPSKKFALASTEKIAKVA